ncbi:V-type ATP synthase subunit E [Isobaculum melis]|uniref:V/A-type H+-transporting ATPase subunit E n=1 Tax=Isobaculum melis TaxID=142588 RepID=A0A1H9TCX0_9LACT|nr:V-type ATP synthase subunit E [Isobaculum melis]SER95180.1 V/A-type H+-transporting ATPase subunit E [Isobaculum melis]
MAEVSQLAEKIMAEAEQEKQVLLATAETEKANRVLLGQEEVMIQTQRHLEKARSEMKRAQQQELSKIQLNIRNEQLTLKQAEIEKVFVQAEQKLAALEQPDFLAFVAQKVNEVPENGAFILALGEKSTHLLTDLTLLNQKLEEGKTLTLATETIPGKSGFTLNQTGIEFNFIFEEMLQMLREEMIPEISTILFK